MRFTCLAISTLSILSLSSLADASFLRDVARSDELNPKQASAEDALLAHAVPLDEYRSKLRTNGYDIPMSRELDEEREGDDYYVNADEMFSFDGYSLKYAKCQPVQRFSEDSIKAGEYSPMIVDDIVILRLCPYRFCSTSGTFGCHYNYAEYAVGLVDYVRIMLRYNIDKKEQMCDWCNNCYARRLDENAAADDEQGDDQAANEENDDNQNQGDDAAVDNGDDQYQGQGDDAQATDDDANKYNWWNNYAGDDLYGENDDCYSYQKYCYDGDGNGLCGDDAGDDGYLSDEEYLDYLQCVNVKDEQHYNYYVRPRCDGSAQTIKMGLYYDQFCSQYAGNEVSLKNFGLGFKDGAFKDMYSASTCLSCSDTSSPPYFYANSNMCNRMHVTGAKCTKNLQYDLFGDDGSSSSDANTQCSFIESVRFGTYDEKGQLYTERSFFGADRSVTDGQKWGLGISLGLCGLLAVYSCYLHHAITNLLIKSLSHTELLPPPRARRNSRSASRRSSSGRRKRMNDDEEEDWEVKGGVPA